MKIDVNDAGGVTIIEPQGKITIAGGDVALRHAVERVITGGGTKVLVNLSNITALDSSGLGELIASSKLAESHGARIKLLDLDQRTTKLMTMTRLVGLFEIHEDQEAALASFAE
jgi:anti-sigma B factor antagonist